VTFSILERKRKGKRKRKRKRKGKGKRKRKRKRKKRNLPLTQIIVGVGTIFDALELEKDMIAVPNTTLMNNHQEEIALEMVFFSFFPFFFYPF
jgi:hypothetical protein